MKSNKLNSTNRKEIGIELRRTHFNLGNDNPYYLSQYRQDYPAHDPSMHPLPVMDSVTLRRTHFKLGDYKNPYSTTNMEQNKNISKGSHPIATLDQNLKNDLRSSHFILGNSEPSFKTISQSEFYDKSKLKDNPDVNFKAIEKGLRSHNYVLGDDKPDYKSETQAKYIAPQYSGIPKQHISTQELQRSHYNFGNYNDPWVTTQQASYYPKEAAVKFYSKNLTKTNFILGDTNPTFKSVSQETFVPHQIEKSNINKDLAQDLRKHHFNFGNDNYGDQLTSLHKQDFVDHSAQNSAPLHKLDPQFLRASHFSLGDNCQAPRNHYATTYSLSMNPKECLPFQKQPNNSFKSSLVMNGDGSSNFVTESRANYIPKANSIDPNEVKVIKNTINEIKSSHFNFGENKNDYLTTTGTTYKYDPYSAMKARGNLEKELKDDLRSTHYKLGYMQDANQTTHQSAYIPYQVVKPTFNDPNLRKSHFDLNMNSKTMLNEKTIYMTDYTEKVAVE